MPIFEEVSVNAFPKKGMMRLFGLVYSLLFGYNMSHEQTT